MVSKITVKKTPTKQCKDHRNIRNSSRKKTPLKSVSKASSVIVSSIRTCKRRLLDIFSRLAALGATPPRNRRGFRRLRRIPSEGVDFTPCNPSPKKPKTLPPLHSPQKLTVFLDLDETLVHSQCDPPPARYDFVVSPFIDGERVDFYVQKRPGVDEFLSEIGRKRFEAVVFTAGLKEYASLVLDRLDTKGVISHRLYRDSCKEVEGRFVKDLGGTGRDLRRVLIVDDNPGAYELQPENAVPVAPFVDQTGDKELSRVMGFLKIADCFPDVREAIACYLPDENPGRSLLPEQS